ncbi:strawberry notch family protein (plasmid) [Brevundimonas sp. BH3]|uniref:strawberry notch-like NTP hydrolase domain-containing protein n=1 Tax=Brevundimonas sp. BH3 TaxID=3133089 RepID=UPI00315963B7
MSSIAQNEFGLFGQMTKADGLIAAAWVLSVQLAKGRALDAKMLRATMEQTFNASDAQGAWDWRDAYEAAELAQVMFLRRNGSALIGAEIAQEESRAALHNVLSLTPSQTRRSERQMKFQQFSTPIDFAYVASVALNAGPGDVVLEPSAGTGLLAIFAELAGARVLLNELDNERANLLDNLFRESAVTRFNAEHINDMMDQSVRPNLVLMNPPFSVAPNVAGISRRADFRHIQSALARLPIGGRLVAITGENLNPANEPELFAQLIESKGQVLFTQAVDGKVYARHGTTVDTRLIVIEKSEEAEAAQVVLPTAKDTAELLASLECLPQRRATVHAPTRSTPILQAPRLRPVTSQIVAVKSVFADLEHVSYVARDQALAAASAIDGIYESYNVGTIDIAGANQHPSTLVESVAMSAVRLPMPSHRPLLPAGVVSQGKLSGPQLETVIYAGEAHSNYLPGFWKADESLEQLESACQETGRSYRKGFFLGDGTGAGKGRSSAGVALDNWLNGRRKILWVSKNEPLIEDARRDWSGLGGNPAQIVAQGKYALGTQIGLKEGIIFTTYSTLRVGARGDKASRLTQILDWLGSDFDGLIIFDEAHALANAATEKGARGDRKPSEQGKVGLRLQNALPDARILYVSATGATVVANLGYASRLGLWGGANFPFPTRASFVAAMQAGGVAAMEVLARDLKALGLYIARSLSYSGVEYEMLEHELSPEQVAIYDAYADAFAVIHNNLEAALVDSGVSSVTGKTLNGNAKGAARSAFESSKQRFFSFLVTAMKMPTVLRQIEADLEAGMAPVVQIVSTGEALMERRLAEIPVSEWNDVQVDVTPREYVIDYLNNSFPIGLFELYTDEEGNERSRPAMVDGNPVVCQKALERREALLDHLCSMPPVQAALDQLIHHFGTDKVAEVTGRSRRIVKKLDHTGARLAVENRPASSNKNETTAFQDGTKSILVFSDAGGTGRSYHADLGAKNQARRSHYLLEAGWKADAAVQGLGRTNRTNQAQAPLLRPVATNVKGEKRFLSTIARRLDSLGALTKGQRQTGGQGLFRPEDNLESDYARTALRRLYQMLVRGQVQSITLGDFQAATGLDLLSQEGGLKDDLPPITTFLNRVLALRIEMQNAIFAELELRIEAEVELAKANGTYEVGVENLRAERFELMNARTIYTHEGTGAETQLVEVRQLIRSNPLSLAEALNCIEGGAKPYINEQSGRAAFIVNAPSFMSDDGTVEERRRIVRPMDKERISLSHLNNSHWKPVDIEAFAKCWTDELASIPEFIENTFHMVTGLLLPIWSRLPSEAPRIYRLQTSDNQRFIGRKIDQSFLPQVCRAFGLETPTIPVERLVDLVMSEDAKITLADGYQLKRSLIAGARRLEVIGLDHNSLPMWRSAGMMSERIAYQTRAFIPLGARCEIILNAFVEKHPVLGIRAH